MVMAHGFRESTNPATVTRGKETKPPFLAKLQAVPVHIPGFITLYLTLNRLRSKEENCLNYQFRLSQGEGVYDHDDRG